MSPTRKHSGPSSNPRPRKRVIRVLTEGRVTEPDYIDILRTQYSGVSIKIVEKGSPPKTLVDKARRYQSSNDEHNPDFDEIWCIFDVDEHPNIEQAIQEARDNGINVAVTNPCFELWLVLHYHDQTGHIDGKKIQREAERLGILKGKKEISKGGANVVRKKYDDAKSRAKRLEQTHRRNGYKYWHNPSSRVWRFVDRLALLAEVGDG